MTILHRARLLLVGTLLLFFGGLGPSRTADAGTLQLSDREHALSAVDTARLRSVLAAAPFDGRFVVTSEYPEGQELSRYVGSLVTQPNLVVVGLDPQHHRVQVHFGSAAGIPRSEWPAIERAGNESFRRSDWGGGAAAIFQSASRATATAGETAAEPLPLAAPKPSLVGPALLLLLVAGGIGLAVYFARRRSGYGSYGSTGYPGSPPLQGPGYSGTGYGPQQGGMGPLGGGLIGAGLGGLAGYELGKMEGERERGYREPLSERVDVGNDAGGNYDAGGGGSSWDDGGGSDDGGGGFDGGGGGGSDF